MWILLKFFNDYDQHGGYFAGVFDSHHAAKAAVDHLERKDAEYSWYQAVEVPLGELIKVIDEDENYRVKAVIDNQAE